MTRMFVSLFRRSHGQKNPVASCVQVFAGWPFSPWTKTILVVELISQIDLPELYLLKIPRVWLGVIE
jgi:hypothetical protein